MTRPPPKRPLLTVEDRKRLRRMAAMAARNGESGVNRSYCKGVADVLEWLDNEPMGPMLREVTG